MKTLLLVPVGVVFLLTTACSTLGQAGGSYRDQTLSNLNPAPAKLTPPDYVSTKDGSPVLDDTYLSSQADYHYTMGETFSNEGQAARAVEEYKSTLIYDPKSVHVRLALGREYVRLGMVTEAIEQTEIAVEMAPKSLEARMQLGGLYTGLKMYQPARDQFQAVLDMQPGHAEAAVYLGALLAEERKYDESIKYFESLAKNPAFKESEKAHYYIGRVRAEQGPERYADAKKAFNDALKIKPEYPEAAVSLAGVYRAEKKGKEMEQLLRTFQDKFGPEREMSRLLSQYYMEKEDYDHALEQLEVYDGFERDNLNVKMQIALILIEKKKFETAAQRLEDVLLLAPESDKVRYWLGAVYEELNRPALAIEHYSHIPAGSPNFADAVMRTGNLQKSNGNMEKAIETLEAAIKKQEDEPRLYAFYATLLDEQKSFKKALKMLTSAVERFPTNTQLRFFLGTMQDRNGNPKETIAQMSKVIEQDEDHVQALNYLAYTYAELGRELDVAMKLATRAMALQPNDGYIMDTMGWIYFKRGETEEAIKYLEAAYKLKSDEAIIAEHLGDAYLRHQMWQKAQRMYQKAAQLEGDGGRHAVIQEKIANIRTQSEKVPSRMPASLAEPKPQ